MGSTAIVTDSTACLPESMVKEYGIRVVPLYVNIGDEVYRDGVDMTAEEFYKRLPHSNPLPTTSQPSAGDFAVAYRDLIAQGASEIISIHLSSGISGTVNSAQLAAKEVTGARIEILDTQCIAAIQTLAVEAVAVKLRGGASFEEACGVACNVIQKQRTIFVLDTLEYLYKGGRIGGAAALVGSLLQFKPVLHFKEGKIDVLERVRKSSRAPMRMIEIMRDVYPSGEPLKAMVMHADCRERAEALAELARTNLNTTSMELTLLTPVVGTHAGPGALGLCCCPASAFA